MQVNYGLHIGENTGGAGGRLKPVISVFNDFVTLRLEHEESGSNITIFLDELSDIDVLLNALSAAQEETINAK